MTVKLSRAQRAFTLIELLVVISIMGLLAAITVPALNNMKKADAMLATTRQMSDDVALARHYAISGHTTVYMIFVPPSFWTDPAFPPAASSAYAQRTNLFEKQFTGYTFVTLRSVGDQPGQGNPRYLAPWRTLPEGTFVVPSKFGSPATYVRITDPGTGRFYDVYGFHTNNILPFPTESAPAVGGSYVTLPYIAFNYLGQLTVDGVNPSGQDEYIPLARGAIAYAHDLDKMPQAQPPIVTELPPGNSTNAFNLIHIDWLTGRARLEHPVISGS